MPRINPTLPADGDDAIVEPYNAAITAILGVLNGAVDADNLAAGAVTLAGLAAAVQQALVPTASIVAFGGAVAPTGWLLCDGSSYLRSAYSALFAALGTNYGFADGTHFNVPDLRGRVPVGADAMGGTAANRIQRTSTLTTVNGSPTATVGSATGLSQGMVVKNVNVPAGTTILSINGTTLTLSANATANGTTIAATFSMLGNDATVLGAVGGADVHTLVSNQMPSHTHQVGAPSAGAGSWNGFTFSGAITNATAANQFPSGSTGVDQAHPNMQPSLVVNYIIKT